MAFKKYGIIYLLIGLVIALSAVRLVFPKTQVTKFAPSIVTSSPVAQLSTTVMIDFGDKQVTYSGIVSPNAYLALVEAAKQDNLEVETKDYDFGVMVEKVGSYQSDSQHAWLYYINGTAGDVAADQKLLGVGDRLEWKYEKLKN